jgi:glutathione S-transferase
MILVIGNKRYSSWSMRPWLCLKVAGIPFEEKQIFIHKPDSLKQILKYSPAGRVPCLVDGKTKVWDSLSICEYVAEKFLTAELWPNERHERAYARSICAEMHSGFQALRTNMNMNCVSHFPGKGWNPDVQKDVERIIQIWDDCRKSHKRKGPFLFGAFTIADAFYAPVVTRFRTYGVHVDKIGKEYMETIYSLPAMQQWLNEARKEKEIIEDYEKYRHGAK